MTGFTDMKLWDAYDKGADAVIGKPTSTAVLTNLFNIHLLSLDERWKKSAAVAPIATVTSKSDYLGKEVKLGRLGLFILEAHAESVMGCKVDSVIAFDFAFETGEVSQLTGRGRIAWTRSGSGPELDDGVWNS